MWLAALPATTPTLMALQLRVERLGFLPRNPDTLLNLRLPLPEVLYINLPLHCPDNQGIQGQAC